MTSIIAPFASAVPATLGRGVLEAEIHKTIDGVFFTLKEPYQQRRDIVTLLDLLDLDNEEVSVTVLGEEYSFRRSLLATTLSDLSLTSQVVETGTLVAIPKVQKTIVAWAQHHDAHIGDVMQAFKRYLYYGLFNSRSFKTQGKKNSYNFDFQHACLSFADAIKDAGLECLVLAEMCHAWIRYNTALGPAKLSKLFMLALATDGYFVASRKLALENPGSSLHKDYVLSSDFVHTKEWQGLDQRLLGLDSPSALALEYQSGTIYIPSAAKLPRSSSAKTLTKLIEEAKKEAAAEGEVGIHQQERGTKRASSLGTSPEINSASREPKKLS